MATPDWTTVPDTSLEPGDPIRSIDIIAINNHAAAMAGGATGAPKIALMAIEVLSSGTTIRSRIDSEQFTADSVVLNTFSFMQIGNVNVYAEHKASSSTSTLTFKKTRGGVTSTINTWSTTSSSYIARNVTTDVLPGDTISIVLEKTGGAGSAFGRNARFRTNGENMWPGSGLALENDYTVA